MPNQTKKRKIPKPKKRINIDTVVQNKITGKPVIFETVFQKQPVIKDLRIIESKSDLLKELLGSRISKNVKDKISSGEEQLSTKPNCYFGPFRDNALISKINVVIGQTQNARWYHGDFFNDNPDSARYKPFYGNLPLSDEKPAYNYTPGLYSGTDGSGYINFTLDKISYSGKYGGTIELLFMANEDVGFELRKGQIIWDVKDLKMKVFVTPTCQGLTSPHTAYNSGNVMCELETSEYTAYSLISNRVSILDDLKNQEYNDTLKTLSNKIASDIQQVARRFTGGFLWSKFPDLLGVTSYVTGINISDDFIDIKRRDAEIMVSFSFRCEDCTSDDYDIFIKHHLVLTLRSLYIQYIAFEREVITNPDRTFDVPNHEDTPYVPIALWSLSDFVYVPRIYINVSGYSTQYTYDAAIRTVSYIFNIDYNKLNEAVKNGQTGLIERIRVYESSVILNDNRPAHYIICIDINLIKR